MSLPVGSILLLATLGAFPQLRILGQPRIEGLRAIQYEYSPDGGLVVLEWRVEDGEFTTLVIAIDGVTQTELPGDAPGVQLHHVALGSRHFSVVGIWDGPEAVAEMDLDVVETSPVEPPFFNNGLFFGYEMSTLQGKLQISWGYPYRDADPYRELEVTVDDRSPDRIFYRLAYPDSAVTFSGISEGLHTVSLTAVTESYASEPVTVQCRAEWVPSPTDLRIESACQGDVPGARVTYRIPWGAQYSKVGAWAIRPGEEPSFLGYFPPHPPEIRLIGIEKGPLEVELAGAKFEDEGADAPYAISNFPGETGSHALAAVIIRCGAQFRRGDVTGDGSVNLADAISILTHLFLTDESLSCPAAADIDDGGEMEITDGVRLLDFLFLGGGPPAAPGPWLCGADPTLAEEEICTATACEG